MVINVINVNQDIRITPEGKIDSLSSGELGAVLDKQITDETRSLTLDFYKVDYISSKGLRVLVSTYKKLDGRQIKIVNANVSVMEVFRLSGLLKVFSVNGEE